MGTWVETWRLRTGRGSDRPTLLSGIRKTPKNFKEKGVPPPSAGGQGGPGGSKRSVEREPLGIGVVGGRFEAEVYGRLEERLGPG